MKRIFLCSCLSLAGLALKAQTVDPSVIATGGEFFTGSSFTNSYTIGEMALVETYSTSGFILTQGFQQPDYDPVGISENSFYTESSVFPNPGNGDFTLSYNLEKASRVRYEIFNAAGQIVQSETSSLPAGPRRDHIDLKNFSSGLYLLRCTIDSGDSENLFFVQQIQLTR